MSVRHIAIKTILFAALVAGGRLPARAQGCSACRAALESSEEGRQFVASLESGVLLLMGAPYVMIGAAGYAIVRAYRKGRSRNESGAEHAAE
jgi:hypothetical protein